MQIVKAAVVQAAPVLFDKTATIEKTIEHIETIRQNGCHLVLFPEAYIPAYPRGFSFGMKIGSRSDEGRKLYQRYWENYMPMARMALYGKGVQLYLAPTADSRETWQSTVRHIACEGRCFVLGCNQYVTKDMYPANLETIEELSDEPDEICPGGSVIISPFGDILAGPVFGREDVLYADLDFSLITRAKLDFDVVGHYSRPDIFQLHINEGVQQPVTFNKPMDTKL